ncbi:MAG: BON domain-containing protein [Rickettsia endosymbiont of Bryobia graminum]|nr:BON domain-containing protein [Rickettsia endosymbiont of Bryobia graminum]
MYINTIAIIIMSFSLTSCMPVIFTAAAGSTLAIAKDQSIGETIDDVKISGRVQTALMKDNFKELYTKIKVEVSQGRVLLTGIVDNEDEALKAVEIVWGIEGVQEVVNELILDKNSGQFDLAQYTRDSLITAQIKAKTFANRDIKFVNYTIVTVRDIVYIFGIARSEEELERVCSIASEIKGVRKVVCHAKINEG